MGAKEIREAARARNRRENDGLSAYDRALKNLSRNQELFQQQERPQGTPQAPVFGSAFNKGVDTPWMGSQAYEDAAWKGQRVPETYAMPQGYVDPLFQNAPDVNPQSLQKGRVASVTPPGSRGASVADVPASVTAPQYTPPVRGGGRAPAVVRNQPGPVAPAYVPDRQRAVDVYDIMSFDRGSQGYMTEW